MQSAPLPENEPQRLQALLDYEILDTPPEKELDDLARLASAICNTPIALVSLIDRDRQWFKSRVGVSVPETPRDIAFCAHAIHEEKLFEIPNALNDHRFQGNPLVTGEMAIRFYAGQPLRTSEGLPIGTLCVLDVEPRELTPEQHEAMRVLSRQVMVHLELRRSLLGLARTHRQLLELSELKDNFMRIASHDLKNPLTVLKGAGVMLRNSLAPGKVAGDPQRQLVGMICRTTDNMQRIIEDFLDFRAISDGQLRLRTQDMALNAIASEVIENQREYANNKAIELCFAPDPALPMMAGDPDRLRQVITNLVGNAIKFSPPAGSVQVRTGLDGDVALFEVLDAGPGLRPEDLAKLFQRYARLSAKPTGGESSSGIGLYICRQLVELHGGEIGAENNPGKGARFWFRVPLRVGAELVHG